VPSDPSSDHLPEESGLVPSLHQSSSSHFDEETARYVEQVSTLLTATLESTAILSNLARLVVPQIADFCLIYQVTTEGEVEQVAAVHRDPEKERMLVETGRQYRPRLDDQDSIVARVARTGEPVLLMTRAEIEERAKTINSLPSHLTALSHKLKPHSSMVLPLTVHGRTLGAMVCSLSKTRRGYRQQDVEIAERLAQATALGLENALLHETLQKRAEELTLSDRRKDEFIATLSHELRNPIAAIAHASYALERVGSQNAQAGRLRAIIGRQTRHLTRLVDDLLDISRVNQGRIELRLQHVSVREAVEHAVDATCLAIEARGHDLTVVLPDEPLWVDADPNRIEQIVVNLLGNAAKYTDAGGQIRLVVEREGDEVVIRVADNGIGILEDMLPHIFDLFTQSRRAVARSEGGLGIGLTLVRSLVELHGGRVAARSDGPGKGSEFIIWLPLVDPPDRVKAEGVSEKLAVAPTVQALRVLAIEDNVDAADALAELLELWGYNARIAHSGQAGVAIAREFQPQVVIVDIGLPGMDGYDVARRLREEDATANAILVALTGYGHNEDRARARTAGFDRHLTKPVDPDTLYALLARIGENAERLSGRR
jgi:signal transduction histidine kinase/ActR/RegA family two-component response regulator